jgi:nitrate reductase cytochrome c-type subunit
MFNTLWTALVGLVAVLVAGLGVWVARLRHQAEKEAADRLQAEHDLIERFRKQQAETRQRYERQPPVDPAKRSDFERP